MRASYFVLWGFFLFCFYNSKSQLNFNLNAFACTGYSPVINAATGTIVPNSYVWTVSSPSINIINPTSSQVTVFFPSPGNFTITLTVSTNTGNVSVAKSVSITPTPTLNIVQNNYTTCIVSNFPKFSKPVVIIANGASTYSWQPAVPPPMAGSNTAIIDIRPQSSVCYTVTGNIGACTSTAVACVTVIPQFTINFSPLQPLRCIPDSAILMAVNASSNVMGPASFTYLWNEPGLNQTLNSYTTAIVKAFPLTSTTYTLQMFDTTKCVSLPFLTTVEVANCTGMVEQPNKKAIGAFPNPFQNKIAFETDAIETELKILNAFGQIVYFEPRYNIQGAFDGSGLQSGLYYFILREGDSLVCVKAFKL